MRTERVIVDAGPLVAILNRHDARHQQCGDFLIVRLANDRPLQLLPEP